MQDDIVEALHASSLAAGIHVLPVSMRIFDEVLNERNEEQKT
jgi:hypothetical protein